MWRQMDLSLSWNQIGNAGAAVIAEGVKCNLSLSQLHLEGCGITETGARRLGTQAQSVAPTLQFASFPANFKALA